MINGNVLEMSMNLWFLMTIKIILKLFDSFGYKAFKVGYLIKEVVIHYTVICKRENINEVLQMEIRKKYNSCYNFSNTKR